jgi:WD40 repeat protein
LATVLADLKLGNSFPNTTTLKFKLILHWLNASESKSCSARFIRDRSGWVSPASPNATKSSSVVTTAIDAIESGQLRLDDIETQPPGRLSSLYEMFFNRLFRDDGVEFQAARQVLEVMAAAREPLGRKHIAAVTGLDAEKALPPILGRLAAFLPVREGRYSLFHRSLFEWLTGWHAEQDQPFAGPYHLSLTDGHKRLADWAWIEYINALIADYDYLLEDKDLQLVQSAIRLSAHVLTRDSRQLAGQLVGRLLRIGGAEIQALLKQAYERKPWRWFRPLKPTLSVPGGSLIRTFEGHASSVNAVAMVPDAHHFVSASSDRTLRLWDLETGQLLRTFEGNAGSVNAVVVTPDGRRAISASRDGMLRLWELEAAQTVHFIESHLDQVVSMAMTPDGRRAVSASYDRTLRLWDLESGEILLTLKGHADKINAVAVTPDGRCIVSASEDRTLRLWDLQSGKTLVTLEGRTGWVFAAAVTPSGRRVVSSSGYGALQLCDLSSGKAIRAMEGNIGAVTAVAVTPDGRWAVAALDGTRLQLWDVASGKAIRTLEVRALSPRQRGRELGFGVKRFAPGQLHGHMDRVNTVALTPDGRRAVSGSVDRTLRVWDLETGEILHTLRGHTFCVNAVSVTLDGCRAVSAALDHTVRLWDLESGKDIATFTGDSEMRCCAAFSECRTIVAGDASGRVHFLRLVEADQTKPAIGETKIQLLHRE